MATLNDVMNRIVQAYRTFAGITPSMEQILGLLREGGAIPYHIKTWNDWAGEMATGSQDGGQPQFPYVEQVQTGINELTGEPIYTSRIKPGFENEYYVNDGLARDFEIYIASSPEAKAYNERRQQEIADMVAAEQAAMQEEAAQIAAGVKAAQAALGDFRDQTQAFQDARSAAQVEEQNRLMSSMAATPPGSGLSVRGGAAAGATPTASAFSGGADAFSMMGSPTSAVGTPGLSVQRPFFDMFKPKRQAGPTAIERMGNAGGVSNSF